VKTAPRILGALAALALPLSASTRAHACWDGYFATVHRVAVAVPGGAWSPEAVRAAALWGIRIDALLPAGTLVESYHGLADLCVAGKDGACGLTLAELTWEDGKLSDLFAKVAVATGATPARVKRARALGATPLSFQVFATRSEARAEAFAGRINDADAGVNGFYSAGGFPGRQPTAHVVSGIDARGRTVFRVVMGAFLSRAEAVAGGAELTKETGIAGFVRPL
jgi:hypothetical protein